MKSIGIKLADGTFYPIIKDGSVEKKTLDVTTVQDNQTKVQIDLYRSDSDSMDDAEYVDSLEITNLNPHPNGEPSLHLNLSLDETGHLQADVVDPETGRQSETQVTLVSRTIEERAEPANFQLDTTTADALADIDAVDSMLKNSIEDNDETSESSDDQDFIEPIPSTIKDIEESPALDDGKTLADDFENPEDASLELPDYDSKATEELVKPEEESVPDLFSTKLPDLDLSDFDSDKEEKSGETFKSDDFGLPKFGQEDETAVTSEDIMEEPVNQDFTESPSDSSDATVAELPDIQEKDDISVAEDDFNFDLESIDLPPTGFAEHDDATLAADMAAIKPGKFKENEEEKDTVESSPEDVAQTTSADTSEEQTLVSPEVSDSPSDSDFDISELPDLSDSEPKEEENTESKNKYADWDSSAVLAAAGTAFDSHENDDFTLPDFDNLEPTGSSDYNVSSLPDFDDTELDNSLGLTVDANEGTDFTVPDFDNESPSKTDQTFDSIDTGSYTQGSNMFEGLYDKDRFDEDSYEEEEEDNRKGTALPVTICIICAIICVLGALLVLFVIPSNINILNKRPNGSVQIAQADEGKNKAEGKVSSDKEKIEKTEENKEAQAEKEIHSDKEEPKAEEVKVKEEKENKAAEAKEENTTEPAPLEAKEDKIVVAKRPEAIIPDVPAKAPVHLPDTKYRVRWGDTLWDISASYYKNPWRYGYIARYNGIRNPDYIQAGQIILIPAE